jgi:murein DD-endopeptidase MepM/ murein hydrolase activator NlpD
LLYDPVLLPGGTAPLRELPPGLDYLALAPGEITPGSAFALRARPSDPALQITLDAEPLVVSSTEARTVAIGATGAFYPPGQPLLSIRSAQGPLWEQPLLIHDREWTWEDVTFTNAAVLDPELLRQERERLQAIWDEVTPQALWQGEFRSPIIDYVEISSYYGARRSVNGGPYSTYHEGTDYSAYGGTPVRAPAAGQVVLAEELAVRGGAVILDHGLGIHSGYYHLSAIHARLGQIVRPGDLLGEVGTTGRSTGNHLHWDMLVGRTWIDGYTWLDQGIGRWLSPPAITDHRLPEE